MRWIQRPSLPRVEGRADFVITFDVLREGDLTPLLVAGGGANLGSLGWKLTTEQSAKLDAASEVAVAYPYWHQWQFGKRNPKPA